MGVEFDRSQCLVFFCIGVYTLVLIVHLDRNQVESIRHLQSTVPSSVGLTQPSSNSAAVTEIGKQSDDERSSYALINQLSCFMVLGSLSDIC